MHNYLTAELARQRQAELLAEADHERLIGRARRAGGARTRTRRRILVAVAAVAVAVGLAVLPLTAASAQSWYGRPNTMFCVYTTVIINPPTNVTATGDVVWVADVHVFNPGTGAWESRYQTAGFTNRARSDAISAGITEGPWLDQHGSPTYSVEVAVPTDVVGPVEVAVYNHFYSVDSAQWVGGFWADSTLTGTQSCTLSGGPIVV
jgi:hypothetical protein